MIRTLNHIIIVPVHTFVGVQLTYSKHAHPSFFLLQECSYSKSRNFSNFQILYDIKAIKTTFSYSWDIFKYYTKGVSCVDTNFCLFKWESSFLTVHYSVDNFSTTTQCSVLNPRRIIIIIDCLLYVTIWLEH